NFVSQIRQMYEAGTRAFIELGPKSALSGMTAAILDGKPHLAVSFDGQGGGLRGMLSALASLFAYGVKFDLRALFAGRNAQIVSSDTTQIVAPAEWLIDG